MTPNQIELARHALGLPNKKNTTNRNYFCTGSGSTDYADWEAMVASGDAILRITPHFGGDNLYHLTMKAALSVRGPKEHMSREDAEVTRKLEEIHNATTKP